MPKPRILFFGYSEVGYECLSLLLERGENVVALVTHEDNPHEKIWFKTPAVAAREKGVPVFTPESVNNDEWRARLAALQPDLILSVYYRHMIGTKILDLPRLGAWNMHGSLLPAYRGRAPINWAVLHGEPRIGMTPVKNQLRCLKIPQTLKEIPASDLKKDLQEDYDEK